MYIWRVRGYSHVYMVSVVFMNITANSDCMKVMAEFPDKYFDLAVVDPPYGLNLQKMQYTKGSKNGNGAAKRRDYRGLADWDTKPPDQAYFDELFRVSKDQIIWGGNYFTDKLPVTKSWIVWDKTCLDQMQNDFADCELAWCSQGVARVFRFMWKGMIQGCKQKVDRFHPTEKPVELYAWLYQHYAKPGYKILDTHLGSGSSRIAAWDAGLDFVGCEINKYFYEKQEERFARHEAQLSLFIERGCINE